MKIVINYLVLWVWNDIKLSFMFETQIKICLSLHWMLNSILTIQKVHKEIVNVFNPRLLKRHSSLYVMNRFNLGFYSTVLIQLARFCLPIFGQTNHGAE